MPINFSQLRYLVGDADVLEQMPTVPALPMFSEDAVSFLCALSRELLEDKATRGMVDVISYAYWIRKSSLTKAQAAHGNYQNRIGRGVAFHIAPSNVPVNFAVSMTSAFLAGNASIIRVSDKDFSQVDVICAAMNRLLNGEYRSLRPYFCILRYEHNDDITQALSQLCDVRIIWGGNETIRRIRSAELQPRAIELAFADRHSLAIINADEYLTRDVAQVAKGFYTDTYYTDQNACSSPRLVVWTGERVQEARKVFWSTLEDLVHQQYELRPIQVVDKYTALCMLGMHGSGQRLVSDDNYVVRVEVDRLDDTLMNYKSGSGYFLEYTAGKLEEIVPVLNKQCQTVSVLGVDKQDVLNLVMRSGVRGVDRIVELGMTMGLEFVWDGFRMIEAMSRVIYVGET